MSFFGRFWAFLLGLSGLRMLNNIGSHENIRRDKSMRDEDGNAYTSFHANAELGSGYVGPEYEDSDQYYDEDEYDYSGEEFDDYVDYENGDLPDEDIEYLREEYGEDEY